jgi:hypothetical protein
MMYEQFCPECEQVHDAGMFSRGGMCDYCYSMKGLDHVSEYGEVTVFGEIFGAANLDIDFGRGK